MAAPHSLARGLHDALVHMGTSSCTSYVFNLGKYRIMYLRPVLYPYLCAVTTIAYLFNYTVLRTIVLTQSRITRVCASTKVPGCQTCHFTSSTLNNHMEEPIEYKMCRDRKALLCSSSISTFCQYLHESKGSQT